MQKLLCLIVSFNAVLVVSTVCCAKEAPIDWYPDEFARLSAADWPEMKRSLDAVRTAKVHADVPLAAVHKAWFTIARIAAIPWEGDVRDQVCNYLLDFAKELIEQVATNRLAATKDPVTAGGIRKPRISSAIDLAHLAVWSAGKIAPDIPSQRLIELWKLTQDSSLDARWGLRWSILDVLRSHFADLSIPKMVRTLSEMKPLSTEEVSDLESIRRLHELAQFQDERRAWEYVWSVTKPQRPEEVLTAKFRRMSGEWFVLLKQVYPLDSAIAMSIADSATDREKKYAFLDKAVCILQGQLLRRAEIDGNFVIDSKLLKEVESKAQAMADEMARSGEGQRVEGYQNYLKDSLQSMRKQAARPRLATTEKSNDPALNAPAAALPNEPSRKADGAGVGTELRPVAQKPDATFSRPEDRGEDFSKLDSHEVVRRLAIAEGVAEQRKAAKVLGDREIARTLELTEEDRRIVQRHVDTQIEWTGAAKGSDREDANQQLQRLWTLAAPQLMDHLGHESWMVRDAAIKNLSLMRNEDLVSKLIARIEASDDPRFRQFGLFALGRMLEKRESLIPGRVSISDEDSQTLTNRLVIPFLDRGEQAHPDLETKEAISGARRALKNPLDTRMRPATAPEQNALMAAVVVPVAPPEPNPSVEPVPVQTEQPKAATSPVVTTPASPSSLPKQKAQSTPNYTILVIALALAASGVIASILYWRRR